MDDQIPRRGKGLRRRGIPLLLTAGVTAVAGGLAIPPAAHAETGTLAGPGLGLGDFYDGSGYYKGSFFQDGQWLVCGEKGTAVPSAPLVSSGLQSAEWINSHYSSGWGDAPVLTDDLVAGLNRLFDEKLGQSAVADAAIEYATHAVMYPGLWRDLNGVEYASLNEMIAADLSLPELDSSLWIVATQAHVAEFVDIITTTTAGVPIEGEGELLFTPGPDQFTKTVTVDATEGATGTVTLTNAVFADTGEASRDVSAGDVLTTRVTALTEESATVKVSGVAEMTVGEPGYPALLATWQPEDGVNQQASIGLGGVVEVAAFEISGATMADNVVPLIPTGRDRNSSMAPASLLWGTGAVGIALAGAFAFLRTRSARTGAVTVAASAN